MIDLSPEELTAVVQTIDLPNDTERDDHAGVSTHLRSAFSKLMAARRTERPLITATFKTPDGEVSARVQRTRDGVVSLAWMADTHVHGDWTLVRDGDGDGIEWHSHGELVAPPSDDVLSRNIKNVLRVATRAMLVWVS